MITRETMSRVRIVSTMVKTLHRVGRANRLDIDHLPGTDTDIGASIVQILWRGRQRV